MTLQFDDYVRPSTRKGKKWMVRVDGKLVHFGDSRYQSYDQHHDKERRRRYIIRHKNDHIYDFTKPGSWSMWLLWSYPDIKDAFQFVVNTFNPPLDKI